MRKLLLLIIAAIAVAFIFHQSQTKSNQDMTPSSIPTAQNIEQIKLSKDIEAKHLRPTKTAPKGAAKAVARKHAEPVKSEGSLPTFTAKPLQAASKSNIAPVKNWLPNDARATIKLAEKFKEQEPCKGDECAAAKDAYSVAGVVVETSKPRSDKSNVLQGKVKMGDAQERPLVYVQ